MTDRVPCGGLIQKGDHCLVQVLGFTQVANESCGILGRFGDAGITLAYLSVGNGADGTTNISTTDIYLDRDVVRPGFEIEGSIDPGDSGAMVTLPGGGAGIVWARSNRNVRRAWAIDLPVGLRDGSLLTGTRAPVDVGACIR